MKYLEILNRYEEEHNVWWQRPQEDRIVFSMVGYNHSALDSCEQELLAAGLRYDFDKPEIKTFDRVCGRTFVYMRIPKAAL